MKLVKKTSTLYLAMLLVWLLLLIPASTELVGEVIDATGVNTFIEPVIVTIVAINALFISYFWLNGVKDLSYVLYYYAAKKHMEKIIKVAQHENLPDEQPRIILAYCTANDFNANSLEKSLYQQYDNFKTVILDDSSDRKFKDKVDTFARRHNIEVIRRKDRKGFKAGNLNNYFKGRTDYDYLVILDSDEIIPPNFITASLKYFRSLKNTGVVQANHVATRNINGFMKLFAQGVDSHWPTYQMTKHHHGFMSLLGHGAMISRECYEAVGGFPHLVAEDLCFSIEARIKGYYVTFAQDIRCEEEYPVDYLAFKKRHMKWTQGNMEFIKTYTKRIFTSNMAWFEKLDIVLFTYNLPLTAFFSAYIVINLVLLPALGYTLTYSAWLLIPTLVFLLAPMFNDIIFHSTKQHPAKLIKYLAHTFILYGSMFYTSLVASLKAMFGQKAVFHVTPKESQNISIKEAILINWREITFGLSLLLVADLMTGSPLPVLLIAIPSILCVYLTVISNRSRSQKLTPETVQSTKS